MAVKLGATEVSFRLGAATPSKVAIGSAEVWTDVVPTAPGIPTGLTVTTSETAESSVDVSWTAPESDGDSPITGYKVYRSFAPYDYTLHATVSGTSTAVTVPYNGGRTIYIKVSAVNAVGEGNESEATAGTMSDSVPGVMETPSMAVTGVRQLTLFWTPPAVDGGQEITGYSISYFISTTQYFDAVGPGVTEYTLTDPSAGVTYLASVAAINSIGTGLFTSQATATTADPPSAPSFSATTSFDTQAAVFASWSSGPDGGAPLTGYELEYDTASDFSTAQSEPIAAEASSYTLSGLQGGVSYYLRFRALNAAGSSDWQTAVSNPVSASTAVPSVPTGLTVTPNYSNAEWDATWTEPGDGGSAITAYEIEEIDLDFFGPPTTQTLSSTGSSLSWPVSVPDATRYFRIRAVNAVGNGEWSEYVTAYYDTPTVPGAPTINTAQYDGSVTYIAYSPPGDDGNAAITAYTFYFDGVAVSPDYTGADDATFNADYTGQDATMTATNSVGEGAASAAVEVTTA